MVLALHWSQSILLLCSMPSSSFSFSLSHWRDIYSTKKDLQTLIDLLEIYRNLNVDKIAWQTDWAIPLLFNKILNMERNFDRLTNGRKMNRSRPAMTTTVDNDDKNNDRNFQWDLFRFWIPRTLVCITKRMRKKEIQDARLCLNSSAFCMALFGLLPL